MMEYDPELIEAIAAAIVNDNHRYNTIVDPWDKQPEHGKYMARNAAKAALEALENYLAGVR